MQIHELTQLRARTDEGLADLAARAGSAVAGIKGAVTSPLSGLKSIGQAYKVAGGERSLANKARKQWHDYVDRWAATATPDQYEQQLTAWVQKYLLSSMTLGNLVNRDQILDIIKQIADLKPVTPVKEAPEEQKTAGGIVIPAGSKTGQPAAPAAAPAAPAAPTPKELETKEKALWLQLAQEVGRAQTAAYTGMDEPVSKSKTKTRSQQTQGDPTPQIKNTLAQAGQDKNIATIGKLIAAQASSPNIRSTGDAVVDAALRLMGFRVS